ncbi:thioesterase family protein [Paludicola sp. MB14-C6]|uniref:acyl-CoA thioesterase n=1 Tax=Paludihabitans sp. MB14-C6 TaxID=3070656 RepID=UPI0027DD11EB|nr:thioesterase family protein [Paludicola sp. MB14-C6]WMJ22076.1 thioesterase family protein [Paludicola sp. MB14-C6]
MVSKSQITVRYAETDQMGIAHHSVYPIWFEVARTDFIKKIGMTYTEMEKAGIMLPLAELQCKYIFPTHYEDELTVEVYIKALTPARIEFAYTVYRYGEDNPVATGSTLHAWTDTNKRIVNMKRYHNDIYELIEKAFE